MACPVSTLIAPLRDEASHGRDVPRPYVISPPYKEQNRYEQGETFTFCLSLIGTSTKLFPYVIRSFQEMERSRFGHPLTELKGRRGQFSIREVRTHHPFTEERQILWEKGSTRPQKPQLVVTQDDVAKRAEQLPIDHVAINFLSPTRLILGNHLLYHPKFEALILRLIDRLEQLHCEYGEHGANRPNTSFSVREQYHEAAIQAKEIQLTRDETHWVDIKSYSARIKQVTPIGGFVGRASFEGDMTKLRELLVWGEVLHVGKNAVKGDGLYQIENTTID